jgi:fatty acid synthase subunit alpha
MFGRLATVDRDITARAISLNRADLDLLIYMQYNINQCDVTPGENYKLASQQPFDNTKEVIGKPPVYKDGMLFTRFDKSVLKLAIVTFPAAPHTEFTATGDIV